MSSPTDGSGVVAKKKGNDDDSPFARYALFVLASLYTFCFIGALFGFGPMEVMMVGDGAFASACPPASDTTTTTTATTAAAGDQSSSCPAQTQIIVNIGFLATCFSVVTPLIGTATDHYGAPTVSVFMAVTAMMGCACLVGAAAWGVDWLYYLTFALLGLTTFTGSLLSVQVGLYFVGRTQVRVIMWLNTLFDAGSVTYLFLWMIQESYHLDFDVVALLYLGLAVVLFGAAAYFWAVAVPEHETMEVNETVPLTKRDDDDHDKNKIHRPGESLQHFMESQMDYTLLSSLVTSRKGTLLNDDDDDDNDDDEVNEDAMVPKRGLTYGATNESSNSKLAGQILMSEKPANEQLLSTPYLSLVFFFAVSQISCNWSLITAADFLASLGDDDGAYLKLFTLMQPASVLALPLVDSIIGRYGFGAAFQGVNIINFVYITIKVTSTDLHVQVITFVLVAAVRCFLYATVFSFLPSLLSADVVGRGTGYLSMLGGIASFLNIPLNGIAATGNFLTPNLIYLASVLPCVFAARTVQKQIAQETKIKAARKS